MAISKAGCLRDVKVVFRTVLAFFLSYLLLRIIIYVDRVLGGSSFLSVVLFFEGEARF